MATRKEQIANQMARSLSAGKAVTVETVDFNDPNRPKTCLEVDFPILPINSIAKMEAHAGVTTKPIYQMSKYWARRASSVFRSMLMAAATKAPDDPAQSGKIIWQNYYGDFQKKGSLKHLKVVDIFMGGGTTLVEGARLGMQMTGCDLNPVAWFVNKNEFANVSTEEVRDLLDAIEAEVKPQIIPYYYCDGPNGEKGKWTHLPSKRVMGPDFDPLTLTAAERYEYNYEGPEILYTFWAKHGPCQVTGCGHRTPIMTSPVMAIKTVSVKHWEHQCNVCGKSFHIEEKAARMSPDVPLYVAPSEFPYTVLNPKSGVLCPHCGTKSFIKLGKGKNKKIGLTLLVHPEWLTGSPKNGQAGEFLGGSVHDNAASTRLWNKERASKIRLLEVRGELPDEVKCPITNVTFKTGKEGGTVPGRSNYACGACGTVQDVLATVRASKNSAPMAAYAAQAYSPAWDESGAPYGGKFVVPFNVALAEQYDAASAEWETRKETDLQPYWPRSKVPYGFMTGVANGDIREGHGFTHWWTMFNPRQLLVHAQLLKAIVEVGGTRHRWEVREFVLGAFQNYVRNQSMFSFWHMKLDTLAPALSNSNFHPKSTVVETGVFSPMGYGPWTSAVKPLFKALEWKENPWELARIDKEADLDSASGKVGNTEKIPCTDQFSSGATLICGSSTDLNVIDTGSIDLVITDPPFGGLLHYSELSDYFHVWIRLALKDKYPEIFGPELTPKALEVVANRAREPEDADGFYQRLLTECWREAHRILKPGGILAFTFHHSEDEPWVAVLESLFDAGYYLEATYPIRSDETKGEGEFGSKTIEYDIIHVCRKRTEEPKPVSWGRMRREVMADVRQLQAMLENHAKEGLPAADIQVIRRGKALEYFSRHYGKVYVDEGKTISVKDALVGINQLIDEDGKGGKEPPPVTAEPISRQFLRIFDGLTEVARDQMQKFMKGSGSAPDEFEQRGWCSEKNKVYTLVNPLDFARDWQGKHKRKLTSDLDQALVLVGACFDGSGINAADTLKNENFKPHAALKALLEWLSKRGANTQTRNAASRAMTIYNNWAAANQQQVQQMSLFFDGA